MGQKIPIENYYPNLIVDFLKKIEQIETRKICLCGFSDIMKWLSRLLDDKNYDVILCDTRNEYFNYECGEKKLNSLFEVNLENRFIIITEGDPAIVKYHLNKIYEANIKSIPIIYDSDQDYNPLRQDQPYKEIITKAERRCQSMISDEQLFDLSQLIKKTRKVPGSVVEYGSLHGGSGAVLAESLNVFGIKDLYLFDTFAGIPKSSYGADWRWEKSFSNNSFSEVKNAFSDLSNVEIIKGNIRETHKTIEGPFSFAYIASDTIESGEYLMEYIWPRLSKGGIVHTCDYGSYPNCLPLTAYLEKFEKENPDIESYRTSNVGIYFIKN